ncbi:flagellar biosynthesis protein FliR [Thermovirga sp.]|uniref:flagellar biosynthesis protein FliR n=1 Tax=Thermovirga sp. TaxID=2699834 RepID=UPI0025F98E58|nr:flagellar biosynthesis protein FliR [Thermovirga sp.]MBO8153182.1 flagellar biosynthesis protein FliR [Thermovirga sp.]MCD6183228.1 flagellar biosynthesis protein FliR [Thermovirga sp.]
MPATNVQALMSLLFFVLALLISRAVVRINEGRWPGGPTLVFFLRMLLGFVFAAAIYFAFYAFAGIDILNK